MIFDRLRMYEDQPDDDYVRFYEKQVGIPRHMLEEMARMDRVRRMHRVLFVIGMLLGAGFTVLLFA